MQKHPSHLPQGALLRLPQVLDLIPISRSTLWDWVKKSKFPPPIHLNGSRSIFWRYADIIKYIDQSSGRGVDND